MMLHYPNEMKEEIIKICCNYGFEIINIFPKSVIAKLPSKDIVSYKVSSGEIRFRSTMVRYEDSQFVNSIVNFIKRKDEDLYHLRSLQELMTIGGNKDA